MSKSEEINNRIKSCDDLRDIVSAMKAFAGLNMRKAEECLVFIDEYEGRIREAIGRITFLYPGLSAVKENGKKLFVVFGSDIGLCGPFNNRLAEFIGAVKTSDDYIFVIGRKLEAAIEDRGIEYIGSRPSASTIEGTRTAMLDSLTEIVNLYAQIEASGLVCVSFSSPEKGRTPEIVSDKILPPDIEPGGHYLKEKPMLYLSPELVFNELIGEFLYISLYRCYMESIHAENRSRLSSMSGALDNLDAEISGLDALYRYSMQEEITEEIIEIIQSHSSSIP